MKTITIGVGMLFSVACISVGHSSPADSRYLEFDNALPGKVLKVQKVLNPNTGKIEVKLMIDGEESGLDLVTLENQEGAAKRAQNGTLSDDLARKVYSMGSSQTVKVSIHLKYPPFSYPNKTSHSMEELLAANIAAKGVRPVVSQDVLAQRHALLALEDRGLGIAIGAVNKNQLLSLKHDADIASVEEVFEESRLSPDLSTLATSAYNPGSVPSGAGSGVKAATFESGLTSGFLSCLGVTPSAYDASTSTTEWEIRHSNATFRCMVAAAPSASFYHRKSGTFDGSADQNYLIDNGIQAVSMSVGRGNTSPYHSTQAEFLVMDDFAYRPPYPVYVNPAGNSGYQYEVNWQGYNGISVGDVRHTSNTTYEMADCTHAKNPPPIYGSCISGSGANCAGDREMPHVVIPGIPYTGSDFASTCLEGGGTILCASSYSAAIGNGIAADIIASDIRMISWPEKVRAIMVLTAQNIDGGDWSNTTDGRDGSGVVSGTEAVSFAQNHTAVSTGNTAVQKGMAAGFISASDFSAANRRYIYNVPNPKPSGKHLRVVLTWDSNPVVTTGGANALSDMDLLVQTGADTLKSKSWDSNVEVVDVPAANVVAGGDYSIEVDPVTNRIPASGSRTTFFYYALAWEWVKDSAN